MTDLARIPPQQTNGNDDLAPGLTRLGSGDALEPGTFWRAKVNVYDEGSKPEERAQRWLEANDDDEQLAHVRGLLESGAFALHSESPDESGIDLDELPFSLPRPRVYKGNVHLLLDVHEFDGAMHSVDLLDHPGLGTGTFRLLIGNFLQTMEPAHDAAEVRQAEQAAVMQRATDIQDEVARAQSNPLLIAEVRDAAQKAVEEFEKKAAAEALKETDQRKQRESDLRRIHRRAARRSEEAGNPLVPRKFTMSKDVNEIITGGIDAEGLNELTLEARRRTVIAEASAKWLSAKVESIGRTMKELTPYFAERGQVALAQAKKVQKFAGEVAESLRSLNVYVGTGTSVFTIREGESAPTSEPLTLVQQKKFVDEMLVLHKDVDESNFDHTRIEEFYDTLKSNMDFVQQVLPTPRCVVSMAVTRRDRDYARSSPLEAAMNNIANKQVFLLARDGENVHIVWSGEPSHEAAPRLFPTNEDINSPFEGFDGSKIGLESLRFPEAVATFDGMKALYWRFLALCCGLDHRLKLFGEFYPPEKALNFLTLDFQKHYMRFLNDDTYEGLIGDQLQNVESWIAQKNLAISSGSRVFVLKGRAASNSPGLKKFKYTYEVKDSAGGDVFIANREAHHHYVDVPVKQSGQYSHTKNGHQAMKAWLDGPECKSENWFLCIDAVEPEELHRYIYSSESRAIGIDWVRLFKRALAYLRAERAQQAELRDHLRTTALEHGAQTDADVDGAVSIAIRTWRAAGRGRAAPAITDTRAVNEILTLMFPADRLANAAQELLEAFVEKERLVPLRLVRTGKTGLVLYVEASTEERAHYEPGLIWGWVKRLVLKVGKRSIGIGSQSLVWWQGAKPVAAEETVRTWPAQDKWIHDYAEPCKLRELEQYRASMATAVKLLGPVLHNGFGRSEQDRADMDPELLSTLIRLGREFNEDNSHFQVPVLSIPVGHFHASAELAVSYVYLRASLPAFVAGTGSATDLAQYIDRTMHRCRAALVSEWKRNLVGAIPQWTLVVTKTPFESLVPVAGKYEYSEPSWAKISTRDRGGIKAQALGWGYGSIKGRKARQERGPFTTREKDRALSIGRAIDALMGLDPYGRRAFFKSLPSTLRFKVGLTGNKKDYANAREQLVAARNAKRKLEANLSPLVWSAEKGRSLANKFFRRKAK